MKPIHYIICATAVLLSACQNELPDNPTATHGELTFNASVDGVSVAQSRAAAVDTDLTTNGFFLAGYHTAGKIDAVQATAYPNVFDKEVADQQIAVPLVKYENGKFALKTIKWLLDEVSYLSFFGWSQSKPYATAVDASTTGIIGQTFDSNDKGYPWIDIRNANAPLDQTDIVGSRSIDHPNDAVISAVDLDFHHLLSKLTFKAKSTSKANIAFTGVNIKYAASKVRQKARYTFGSDASTIGSYSLDATEFQAGTAPLGSSYPAIAAGAEVVLGSVLLVPQALQAGDVSIELKYKLSPNGGGIAGAEQTKTLPLSAFTFEQGNNYAYSIDIQATDILVMGNPGVEAWNVEPYTALPTIAGPRGDTQLWLDGYDKPYTHSDGKKYWLDRSGYNRHVELTSFYVGYDNTNHCYSFNGTSYSSNQHGGIFQEIPVFQDISAEIVMEGDANVTNSNQPLVMAGAFVNDMEPRNFLVEMGYSKSTQIALFRNINNYVMFNQASTLPYNEIVKRHCWLFNSTPNQVQTYLDGDLLAEQTVNNIQVNAFKKNVIANGMTGKIFSIKLSSRQTEFADVVSSYRTARARYKITTGLPDIAGPKGDVQLLLLGDKAPYSHYGKQYWLDYSGYNRHVLLCDRYASYDATKKCYKFNRTGTGKNPFGAMVPPLETGEHVTVSLITENPSGGGMSMAFNFSAKSYSIADKSSGQMRMLIPYMSQIYMYTRANANASGDAGVWQAWVGSDGNDVYRSRSFYTLVSTPNRMAAYRNAAVLGNLTGSRSYGLGELKYNSLAPDYEGDIIMVKVTRKEQSDAEIKADYDTYKSVFIP